MIISCLKNVVKFTHLASEETVNNKYYAIYVSQNFFKNSWTSPLPVMLEMFFTRGLSKGTWRTHGHSRGTRRVRRNLGYLGTTAREEIGHPKGGLALRQSKHSDNRLLETLQQVLLTCGNIFIKPTNKTLIASLEHSNSLEIS